MSAKRIYVGIFAGVLWHVHFHPDWGREWKNKSLPGRVLLPCSVEPGENLIEVLDDVSHPVIKEKRWRRYVFPRGVQRGAHGWWKRARHVVDADVHNCQVGLSLSRTTFSFLTEALILVFRCDAASPTSCNQNQIWDLDFLTRSSTTFANLTIAATFAQGAKVFPEVLDISNSMIKYSLWTFNCSTSPLSAVQLIDCRFCGTTPNYRERELKYQVKKSRKTSWLIVFIFVYCLYVIAVVDGILTSQEECFTGFKATFWKVFYACWKWLQETFSFAQF